MREILFRAKRKDNGEWVEGVPLTEGWSKKTYIITFEYSSLVVIQQIEVDPSTVCQFTGLKDKNGNKVFEGDVVKTKYGRVCRVTSICREGYVGFDLDALENEHKMPTQYDLFASRNIEIIGNIFDNKELLK